MKMAMTVTCARDGNSNGDRVNNGVGSMQQQHLMAKTMVNNNGDNASDAYVTVKAYVNREIKHHVYGKRQTANVGLKFAFCQKWKKLV